MTGNVLVIGDLHLGVNKDSQVFHKIALDYADWIDSICKDNGIKNIIQLGDIFHDRKHINVATLNCADDFFTKLNNYNIDIVLGNHDCVFNDSADVNSLKIFSKWPNITIHDKITTINGDITFCGWATPISDIPDNQKVIFGHFDIVGFEMSAGTISEHGFNGTELSQKAPLVMSGHYHKPQARNYGKKGDKQILMYAGSCFQLNWGESGEDKYAYILNIDDLSYRAIRNNISPRFEYISDPSDIKTIKNNFVAFTCNSEKYDDIAHQLLANKALGIKYIKEDIRSSLSASEQEESDVQLSGIFVPDLIKEFVNNAAEYSDEEKQKIIEKSIEIYNTCAVEVE